MCDKGLATPVVTITRPSKLSTMPAVLDSET